MAVADLTPAPIDAICPSCFHHTPTPEQERAIRRSERALVIGAAIAHVADARAAILRLAALKALDPERGELKRCMARLDALLGDTTRDEQAA